ncbi:hypothetical protein BGZ95_011009 [Linnemannia exigua]|uniref:F-box domain-containing protein n=1 Tax=Linnemannia exigua TaxID=604196 RepID=A0AAD4DLJ3_9FUNG|nr:hypothetical protein BGZ95_011009 [Linnemannia exigua]
MSASLPSGPFSSQTVFSIPELAIVIVSHLHPPEFLSCAQVCRQWHEVVLPFLWETVDDTLYSWPQILKHYDADDSKGKKDEDWLHNAFVKHGHLIRHLSLSWKASIFAAGLSGQCTNLLSLSLRTSVLNKTVKESQARSRAMSLTPEEGGRTEGERRQLGVTGPLLLPEFEGLFLPRAAMWRTIAEQEQDWTTNQHLWQLVRSNSALRTLRLALSEAELCKVAKVEGVYDILSSLKEINYLGSTEYAILLDRLLERVPTIRHVQMDSARVGEDFTTRTYHGLQTLAIKGFVDIKLFLKLLHSIPNLEHLRLIAIDYHHDEYRHVATHLNNTPSRLKGLHFNIGASFDFGKLAEHILPWLPDLSELTLGLLDAVTAKALVTYCKGLQVFRGARDLQSTFLLDYAREKPNYLEVLLQECRQLKIVDAICHRVDADRLLALPWVCHDLEVLHVHIAGVHQLNKAEQKDFGSITSRRQGQEVQQLSDRDLGILEKHKRCQDQQQKILAQLGLMTHLRVLDLGFEWRKLDPVILLAHYEINGKKYAHYTNPYTDTMDLTLESGLGQLVDLVNLEVFGFEGIRHRIGAQELEWIAVHWPRLRVMRGLQEDLLPMLQPDAKRTELRKRMQTLRPNVRHQSLLQVPESY